jgi:hypothetical protein
MITNDPKLLAERRKLRCMACGTFGILDREGKPTNEAHHVMPKGMGHGKGGDDWWNILTLCSDCHTQAEWAWHRSLRNFFWRFPHVGRYLQSIGWIFLKTDWKLKLIHPAYRDCKQGERPSWPVPEVSNVATK